MTPIMVLKYHHYIIILLLSKLQKLGKYEEDSLSQVLINKFNKIILANLDYNLNKSSIHSNFIVMEKFA